MPVTSPEDNGLVNVGPLPPVLTVSTRVRTPLSPMENDCKLPIGPISFTALGTKREISASVIFGSFDSHSLKDSVILRV